MWHRLKPEMAQELKAVSETEDKIVTVKNDELLFTSLEGDFRRLHRVNKAFMDFLNKNVTRNLVFDDIKINSRNQWFVSRASFHR